MAFQYEAVTIVSNGSNWIVTDYQHPVVSVHYSSNAGHTIGHNADTAMDWEDLVSATHSGLVSGTGSGPVIVTNTGWKFTSPVDAKWLVSIGADYAGTMAAGTYAYTSINVSGLGNYIARGVNRVELAGGTGKASVFVSSVVTTTPGQIIEGVLYQNSGASKGLDTSPSANFIIITRIW